MKQSQTSDKINSIREKFAALKCDQNLLSVDSLRQQVKEILEVNSYLHLKRELASQYYWRARKNEGSRRFSHIRELWYPPSHLVKTYGRLNRPGQSLMYVSASWKTALVEMRPQVGDQVTILQLKLKDPAIGPNVIELGVAEKCAESGVKKLSPMLIEETKLIHQLSEEKKERNSHLRALLAGELTRPVQPGHEEEFKISVAISENLFEFQEIDGIEYPGMAHDSAPYGGAANIVLKPESADRLLCADYCRMVVVKAIEGDNFATKSLAYSKAISPDGEITWESEN